MFEQYHSCISAQYMPVWDRGGGGGRGRGCVSGLKIPKSIVFKVR